MSKRSELHETTSRGDRVADKVATVVGSWRFIGIQNSIIFLWGFLNVVAWMHHWDPYPFILLNLALSWQAANTGPVLQKSANRQAAKDRARDDLEAEEVNDIHEGLELLNKINQQQLEILQELKSK